MSNYYISKTGRFFYWKHFIAPAVMALRGLKKGRVLDLGCGDGLVTRTLKRDVPELTYYGIDKSRHFISQFNKNGDGINYKVADAQNLPFKDAYFSAVVSLEVLEHVDNPATVLSEIRRVLKMGGIFYFTTPLEGDSNNIYGKIYTSLGYDPHKILHGHIQKFTFSNLIHMLKKSGFKILDTTFSAHYLNQIYTLLLKTLEINFGKKIGYWLLPLTFVVSVVSGIESEILRRKPRGLDVQILCRKL